MKKLTTSLLALTLSSPTISLGFYTTSFEAPTGEAKCFEDIFLQGDTRLKLRFRQEQVNDKSYQQIGINPPFPGRASTLSTRLTYNTAPFYHVYGLLDFNNVTSYFNDHHNSGSGTSPSKIDYSMIPDPKGTAVVQAFLAYDGIPDTQILAGRQNIHLDNERFVGTSDFRQMPKTYDAISIVNRSLSNVELFYAFVDQVNTIFQGNQSAYFPQRANTTHLINITATVFPFGDLIAYGYLIHDFDFPNFSTNTYGLRYEGDYPFADFTLYSVMEYARQNSKHQNPVEYRANYYHLNGGFTWLCLDLNGGLEVLGGDDRARNKAFRTPLASLHEFNGYAGKFTRTPDDGLKDLYANAQINFWEVVMGITYHHFKAQSGGDTFGHEWDFSVKRPLFKHYSLGIEFADFSGRKDFGYGDTRKYWFTATAQFC
ncbi:MAG: hypothetical protein AB7I18_09950 [Candidatus Berkiella sp.]